MEKVDEVIRQSLHSEVYLINQVAHYIIQSGGKRLRPSLVLLSAGVLGEIKPDHHVLAAVVEFIHTATLLHDDVVDESSLRRGRATANALFGNAASVLVGDFVYSRAFQMMVRIQNMRIMDILAEATNIIAEGEVLQLMNLHDATLSDEDYLKVIQYKTAKLFEAATRLGAVASNASKHYEDALATYGMHLGTAFQLIDDVLDIDGETSSMGKSMGDDIAEGKPTLPLLIAMRKADDKNSQMIRNALEKGGVDHLPQIIDLVKSTGALEDVRQLARQEANIACESTEQLPDNPFKDALIALAEFAVTRRF
jgi:octaprenyl-diphosphate synthase